MKSLFIISLIKLQSWLPLSFVRMLGAFVGTVMFYLPTRARQTTIVNLQKCLPNENTQQLAKQSLQKTAIFVLQALHLAQKPLAHSLSLITEIENEGQIQAALQQNKGIILITSHLGGFELINPLMTKYTSPFYFLYRPFKEEKLDAFMRDLREHFGNKVVGSDRAGIITLFKILKNVGCVGIPADPEPASNSGIFSPLLGQMALTSTLVPKLVQKSNCTAFFIHIIQTDNGYKAIFEQATEDLYHKNEQIAVDYMNQIMEKYILTYKEQYMWSLKKFKHQQDNSKWYD